MRTDNNLLPMIAIIKCLKYWITAKCMSCVFPTFCKIALKIYIIPNFLDITAGCEEISPRIYKITVLARNT